MPICALTMTLLSRDLRAEWWVARILRSARLRRAALVRDMGLYPLLGIEHGAGSPWTVLRSASPSLISSDVCLFRYVRHRRRSLQPRVLRTGQSVSTRRFAGMSRCVEAGQVKAVATDDTPRHIWRRSGPSKNTTPQLQCPTYSRQKRNTSGMCLKPYKKVLWCHNDVCIVLQMWMLFIN